jgi:hypothetical protein
MFALLVSAMELLYQLGALDTEGLLTKTGYQLLTIYHAKILCGNVRNFRLSLNCQNVNSSVDLKYLKRF